jgi:hypothetical protein
MGFDVDIDVGNDANGQRRPDLLLSRSGADEFFIEATALTGDDVGTRSSTNASTRSATPSTP